MRLLIFILMPYLCLAQTSTTFRKTIITPNPNPRAIGEFDNGDFIIVGCQPNSFEEILLMGMRTDDQLNVLWHVFHNLNCGFCSHQGVTTNGNENITQGTTPYNGIYDTGFLGTYDEVGNFDTLRYFPMPNTNTAIAKISKSSFGYIIPKVFLSDTMGGEIRIIATDNSFNTIWKKSVHSTPDDEFVGPTFEASDGHLYGIGMAHDSVGYERISIWKLDNQGETIWFKLFGFEHTGTRGYNIHELPNGNLVAIGYYYDFPPNQNMLDGDYLTIISPEGEVLSTNTFDNGMAGNPTDAVYIPERDLIVIVSKLGFVPITTMHIHSLFIQASTLDSLHQIEYGFPGISEDVYDIITTNDGGFAILGGEPPGKIVVYKTDSMGCVEPGCFISSTESPKSVSNIEVYPNPASDYITVQFGEPQHNVTITLSNALGQEVKHVLLQPLESTVTVKDLPAGVYFYVIKSAETIVSSGKVVKL